MTVPTPKSLARLLAGAAVVLTGALAAPGTHAAPHRDAGPSPKATTAACDDAILVKSRGRWRCRNMYMARVALDGRKHPSESRKGAKINMLRAGEWVNIRCQVRAYDEHTGEPGRLYDKVGDYFVPDKYMRTYWTKRIPGAPVCNL